MFRRRLVRAFPALPQLPCHARTAPRRRSSSCQPSSPPPCTHDGQPAERTLLALKPDAVQRGLLGTLLQRFERSRVTKYSPLD